MAQVTETVARGILAGQGYTDNEVRQLAHHWLASHGQASVTQQAGTAEVVECGNLYAKVKLRGDAFGSTNVGDVFYSAPQPAPQQEAQNPMAWHEQARAIRDGNEIAASDKYFSARPQIVSADRRKVFQAGFERGWDAALAAKKGGKA